MKPLTIQEHIQLTLVSKGVRPGWLVDSRFGDKDFSIKKFKNLIKDYENIDVNTYDKIFDFIHYLAIS
jgi:hypothetical protein